MWTQNAHELAIEGLEMKGAAEGEWSVRLEDSGSSGAHASRGRSLHRLNACTHCTAGTYLVRPRILLLWSLCLFPTIMDPVSVAAQTDCSAAPLPTGYELVDPAQASQPTATVQCTSSPAFTSMSVVDMGCWADAAIPNMAIPYFLGWMSFYNNTLYGNMTRPLCQNRAWLGSYPVWATQVGCSRASRCCHECMVLSLYMTSGCLYDYLSEPCLLCPPTHVGMQYTILLSAEKLQSGGYCLGGLNVTAATKYGTRSPTSGATASCIIQCKGGVCNCNTAGACATLNMPRSVRHTDGQAHNTLL